MWSLLQKNCEQIILRGKPKTCNDSFRLWAKSIVNHMCWRGYSINGFSPCIDILEFVDLVDSGSERCIPIFQLYRLKIKAPTIRNRLLWSQILGNPSSLIYVNQLDSSRRLGLVDWRWLDERWAWPWLCICKLELDP